MDESDNAETSNLTLDNELSDDDVLMSDVIEAAIEERFAAANRDDSNDGASSESVGKHMFTGSTPALSPSDSSPKPVGSKHNFDLFGSARSRDSTNDENSPLVSLPAPVELPTSTRLGITVKALHVAAEWKWRQGGDDTCGICQMAFEACCVNCKMPGDDCPLVVGMCRHPFHSHCITKWTISQTTARPLCPMCRQEWRVSPAKTVS